MTQTIRIRAALLFMFAALASGGAAAQSTDAELKSKLDQALRTIQELQKRVTTLEQQQKTAPAAVVPAPPAPPEEPPPAQVVAPASAAEKGAPNADQATLEISGTVMLDSIYDFKRMNPQWNSTERPSQIPVNCPGTPGVNDPGCGKDGETVFSIRQTSLAFKSTIPTVGEIKTEESFDLFGVGGGNAQIRLLNAWGGSGDSAWGEYYAVHERRHLSQHHRLLGAERHGVHKKSAATLHRHRQWRHESCVFVGGAELRDPYR
jgi:hypothetical protein